MRTIMVALLALVMSVQGLEAQGKPFSKGPMSPTVGAQAIESGDSTKFNVPIDSIVSAMNTKFPGLRLEHRADLARFVRSLREYVCSEVTDKEFSLARALGEKIDLTGAWRRLCRKDEKLLCDEERCYLSTWCWNITPEQLLPSRRTESGRLGESSTSSDTITIRLHVTGLDLFSQPSPPVVVHDTVKVVETRFIERPGGPGWLSRHKKTKWIGGSLLAGGAIFGIYCGLVDDGHCGIRFRDRIVVSPTIINR